MLDASAEKVTNSGLITCTDASVELAIVWAGIVVVNDEIVDATSDGSVLDKLNDAFTRLLEQILDVIASVCVFSSDGPSRKTAKLSAPEDNDDKDGIDVSESLREAICSRASASMFDCAIDRSLGILARAAATWEDTPETAVDNVLEIEDGKALAMLVMEDIDVSIPEKMLPSFTAASVAAYDGNDMMLYN